MINKSILKKALSIIEQRHKQSENFAYSNLKRAMSFDDFKQNYTKLKEIEFENAKNEVYGNNKNIDTKKLENEQEKILLTHNINPLSLIPHYTCTKCDDTGFVNGEMCICLKHEINNILSEESGFNHKLMSFDDADLKIFDNCDEMKILYNTMKKWCNEGSKYQIILLCGQTGVGKTYLMECMANELIQKENIVYFASAFNVNQNLLKYHTTFDNTKYDSLNTLLDPDYLFIDDLGTEPILKNVTIEGIYNIIADRLEHNKKTIISTNLDLENIEQRYGERIFSRLVNKRTSLCFYVENSDLRLKK